MQGQWEFRIDRGGTFTDVVARDPSGAVHVRKILSDDPARYVDAPLHAIRALLDLGAEYPIPSGAVASVKMGTTLATNALLERKGARVALLVTRGFADLLAIGYQDRPEIFALNIEKPEALAARVDEIEERVLADGTVRTFLDEGAVRATLESVRSDGIEAVAVLFLHSFEFPAHEIRAGEIAAELGFGQVSLSHQVAREIKAVGRGDTCVADAYLTPILRDYVARLRGELGEDVPLRFMQSHGGLTDAAHFSGKNAVLSGPAAGVVACAEISKSIGLDRVIGFDMGGTSTDVSRYDGRLERVFETTVAGVRLKAPMMAINTVASGGGSMLRYQLGRMTVGPESAGARPGPACYRNGGPATVTDANVVLGRVQAEYFPACFGPSGDARLDAEASCARLDTIAREVFERTGEERCLEEVAAGFVRIANETMAAAIKEISVAKGYDAQDYSLCCFGGAGAQHACAMAKILGISTILLHPHAGVLSAYGMGLADSIQTDTESVLQHFESDRFDDLEERFAALEARGRELLGEEGFDVEAIGHERSLDLRYEGVDTYLNVVVDNLADAREAFERAHRRLFGFVREDQPVEVVNLRVESIGRIEKPSEPELPCVEGKVSPEKQIATASVCFDGADGSVEARDTPVYRRDDLAPGESLAGPALIVEAVSTIVVDPGWDASINGFGHLLLHRLGQASQRERVSAKRDPVMIEVFNNLFMSVAEQMGETLERASHSTNIKERRDFSCAVFDSDGRLVANAPHLPVHLGAMGESVRATIEARAGEMRTGEMYVTNDPYHGGSHLPDITVVAPVFFDGDHPVFYVANRGHHADVGGIAPGSMPAFSKTIDEEGVVLHNELLVSEGRFHEKEIRAALAGGPYPARNPDERLSDLWAQVASNNAGVRLLQELCGRYGIDITEAYMGHVYANAAEAMRETIAALPDGVHRAEDHLDSGACITCAIAVDGDRASVDFEGTDGQLPGNLNAPYAVTLAAVLYVFRTLIGRPIPLNAGCLEPIEIRVPEGSLLRPVYPAAVVGGNVETSMRIVDVLYAALGTVACSQGTMNNFTFGTEDWGYYETICGGAGAGPGFDGASAVHTHMTNTRITDPEVLERRYPVVLQEFSVRRGSGGDGEFRGGDGVVRAMEFLEPMDASILSERRRTGPCALGSARPGSGGINELRRGTEVRELCGHVQLSVAQGDVIVIRTPGGGGYSRS